MPTIREKSLYEVTADSKQSEYPLRCAMVVKGRETAYSLPFFVYYSVKVKRTNILKSVRKNSEIYHKETRKCS